uniref:Sulfhydryl oxidase n=1 Tax=African swine fever virus TaxID=10497 RepID=Q9JFM8_ASF|nr:Te-9GL protein [African swine fever virus]
MLHWGPKYWRALHLYAIFFSDTPGWKEKYEAIQWILNFIESLPCTRCQHHAFSYLTKNPLTLNNSEDFQYWTFAFHNNVNNRLNKKIISWSEYKNIYEQSILKTIEYGKTDFIGAWSSL